MAGALTGRGRVVRRPRVKVAEHQRRVDGQCQEGDEEEHVCVYGIDIEGELGVSLILAALCELVHQAYGKDGHGESGECLPIFAPCQAQVFFKVVHG